MPNLPTDFILYPLENICVLIALENVFARLKSAFYPSNLDSVFGLIFVSFLGKMRYVVVLFCEVDFRNIL
ncbi:hypothetical protein [Helicobacter sp. T3_23-1056]